MAWVILYASTLKTPMEVEQSPIEVEIILGHWEAKYTLIEMLSTHATFNSYARKRRGRSPYLWGLVYPLPIHLIVIMVIWKFMKG